MFQNNKLLKILLLGNNSFEDEGARLFNSALSDNTTLEVLDLSWNNFKNRGAILLAEAIQVCMLHYTIYLIVQVNTLHVN